MSLIYVLYVLYLCKVSSHFRNIKKKLFVSYVSIQVDVNLALGQLIRNDMFEEAEPELQQLAYFKTRISE